MIRFLRTTSFVVFALCNFLGEVTANTDIPNHYQEPGLYPNRDYLNHHLGEFIDPFQGSLQLQHVDIALPGDGGFDLKVQRSYNLRSLNQSSPFGMGWDIHFGRVRKPTLGGCGLLAQTKMTLELPDGSQQSFYASSIPATGTGSFLTTQFWRGTCPQGGGIIVYSPDGTRYDMLDNGVDVFNVTRITDRNGNFATISYGLVGTSRVVTGVSASDGRSLAFTYSSGPTGVLTSITANGLRTWTYSIANLATIGVNFRLNSVTPPIGSGWAYTYFGDRGTQAGSYALSQVTYPYGGTISYAYGYVTFLQGVLGAERSTVVTAKSTTDGNWSFSYSPATSGGGYDTTTVSLPGGIGTITYRHFGYWSVGPGQAWKVGLLYQKISGSVEAETYTWDSQVISNEPFARQGYVYVDASVSRPLLASVTRGRDGGSFTTTYSSRDVFGNPQSISESGTRSRTTSKSYANYSAAWILGLAQSESVSGTAGSISRSFDAFGNVSSETRFGSTTNFSYFANGSMSSRTDPRGNSTSYGSYYRGIPQSESRPDGSSISRSVDSFGNVTQQSDGVSNWGYGYDALNRLISISYPSGNGSSIAWNFYGTYQTISRGSYSGSKSYDIYGRRVSETKGGITFNTSVDALGRVRFQSLPGSSSGASYTLDILGRAIYIQRPEGDTRMNYGAGSVVVTNPRGNVTTYRYDRYGNPDSGYLSATEPPEGTAVSLSKDTLGLLLSATQGSKTRSYGYTNRYLTSMSDPETGTTTFSRDGNGNALSKTTGGVTVGYSYDGLNRVKTSAYGGTAGTTSYSYNGRGQLTSLSNPSAARTYTYDGNGNLTSDNLVVDGNTFVTSYAWDSLDGLASITYPQGRGTVTYSPNSLGRPTQARPFVTSASHFASGNPSSITFANGLSQPYNEDGAQRPNSVGGQVGFSYSYDGAGNVTQILSGIDSLDSRTFTYDGADRLTGFSGSRGSGQFNYGATGNLTGLVQPGSIIYHTYDVSERLIRTTGDMSRTYSYNSLGNITSDGINNYTFDQSSMLTCSNCGVSGKEGKFWYDGKGWRVMEERGGNRKYLVYGLRGELLYEYGRFGKTWKKYAYINGKHIATEEGADAPATTTTLSATPATVRFGQPVTLTATVSPAVAGTVTFRAGNTILGTVTLVNGIATLNINGLSPGVASITAGFDGSADYQPSVTSVVTVSVTALAPNDLNGDSKSDLIFRNDATGQINAWLMNGTTATTQTGLVNPGAWTVSHVADFNGDGRADILFRNDDGSVTLWLMNGTTVIGSVGLIGANPDWKVSHVGDFNGDGRADILWRNTNGAVTVWLMDGINVTSRVGLIGADPYWQVTHVADFNGDGKADLLWRNTSGLVVMWLMNGTTLISNATMLDDPNWRVSHTADFNGDGKADLLWRNTTNGSVTMWLINGTTAIGSAGILNDPNWQVTHVGDLNGDGRADLVWRNTNGAVNAWLMNGITPLSAGAILGADPNWRVSHLADYNGDGRADILWRNTADGSITMWLMNGLNAVSQTLILGASPWRIVPPYVDAN